MLDTSLPSHPSHVAPPLPTTAWSPPTLSRCWERAGPTSTLPALPGNHFFLLICFPNKCLQAPSLLTCLCPGEASCTSSPNHFFHCGAGDHRQRSATCFMPAVNLPHRISWSSPYPWWLVDRVVAWLPALGEVHPWKEPSFIVLCLSRSQQHPRGSACTREYLVKDHLLLSRHKVWPSGAGHQRQKSLWLLPRSL